MSILIWVIISFVCARGGFGLRPLSVATASQYASARYIPLVLNTPFNIIYTLNKDRIEAHKFFNTIEEAEAVYNPIKKPKVLLKNTKDLNVVIFILEGISKEHIGALNLNLEEGNYQGYTPFLDSLISESLVFTEGYSNGSRSIDAPPAILSGIPNLMQNAFLLSPYASNKIYGLPYLLQAKGYTSTFFHGGHNGSMGFDNFSQLAGFDKYFGMNEYNNQDDYDGNWGIFDEPFFQRMAIELNKTKEPFTSCVFTLSSHHPYTIPPKYKDKFPKGTMPIHESIGYADYAIREFFSTASQMPWFNNTLFVFTADHYSSLYHNEYKNMAGNYAVPIFFYMHNSKLKGMSEKTAQHTDIMPTILDILHYDKKYIAFGHSLLDSTQRGISVNYYNGVYQIISDYNLLTFNGDSVLARSKTRKLSIAKTSSSPFIESDYDSLENILKSYIQSYEYRMLHNKLTLE